MEPVSPQGETLPATQTDLFRVQSLLQKNMVGVRDELREEMAGVRDELRKEIVTVRTELKQDIHRLGIEIVALQAKMATKKDLSNLDAKMDHLLSIALDSAKKGRVYFEKALSHGNMLTDHEARLKNHERRLGSMERRG